MYCTSTFHIVCTLARPFQVSKEERNLQIPPFFFSQPTNPSSPSGQPPVNGPISPLRQGKTPHPGDRGKNKGADGIAPTLLRKLAIRTSSILQSSAPTVCTRKCRLTLWNNFNRFFIDLCNVHQPGSTGVLLRGAVLRLGKAIFSRVNKSCCMGKKEMLGQRER